jgi:hypothetical protein
MMDATSASPSAVMVDFERLDAVSDQRRRDRLPTGGLRVYGYGPLRSFGLSGGVAYHTTNASRWLSGLAIGEMTQDAF